MLDHVLVFLKNSLNAYLNRGAVPGDALEDPVNFITGQTMDPLEFKLNSISLLMINMEQENILNPPNRYRQCSPDGVYLDVEPEIRMNLYVLFVARYRQYEDALKNLSGVIGYFQKHRVFTPENSKDLDEGVGQLIVELKTPTFSEQNEIWSALRLPYHPSVLYRVKMAVFRDESPVGAKRIEKTTIHLKVR